MRLRGAGYKRIAGSLGLSVNTVKSFCQRNKLGIASVDTAAAAYCKQCGKPLEQDAKRKTQIFCGDACRYAWWNANPARRPSGRRIVCAGCGKVFTAAGKSRKYCSFACYTHG